MSLLKEYREFISKGNVIDLAVGVVIGAAFSKIVTSLVNDIVMPPIGFLLNGINFRDLKFILKKGYVDSTGHEVLPVAISWGNFIQVSIEFLIIAWVIFLMVRTINNLRRKHAESNASPPAPNTEEQLLIEIRDLLKK